MLSLTVLSFAESCVAESLFDLLLAACSESGKPWPIFVVCLIIIKLLWTISLLICVDTWIELCARRQVYSFICYRHRQLWNDCPYSFCSLRCGSRNWSAVTLVQIVVVFFLLGSGGMRRAVFDLIDFLWQRSKWLIALHTLRLDRIKSRLPLLLRCRQSVVHFTQLRCSPFKHIQMLGNFFHSVAESGHLALNRL